MRYVFRTALIAAIIITSCATNSRYIIQDEGSLTEQTVKIELAKVIPIEIEPTENISKEIELTEAKTEETPPQEAAINMKKKPMIALTFDDGPSEFTDSVLDILEQYNVCATFFMMGKSVEEWRDTVIRAVKNGNEVAGHTWSHKKLTDLNNQSIKESIQATSKIIEQVTGVPCKLFFRPPYGHVNLRVRNICSELGYSLINWTVDPQDWRLLNARMVYNTTMKSVKENSIILLHDIYKSTVDATKLIIPELIARGYELVTISELMNHLHKELKPGILYGAFGLMH